MRLSTSNKKNGKVKATGRKALILAACSLFILPLLAMAARPAPDVHIKKLRNSRYQLIVKGRPYIVKGVCYNPIPIGQTHEYDYWTDPNKPWITDGKLMKDMGVNTVRIYEPGKDTQAVKQVIKDLYELYGIRTIMGSWLGFWEYPCPFYGNKAFQDKVKKEALDMVREYKDEPGILLWILGNENNYSCMGLVHPWSNEEVDREPDPQKQKGLRARIYYTFVNDIIKEIHAVDPKHPVALGNGELVGLEWAKDNCPDADLVACIIYRGKTFGNLFNSLKATFDKPILLSEFGADSFDAYLKKEDQNMQAFFLESQWRQIYENLATNKDGAGNCLGGTMFEWTDEHWKHNPDDAANWSIHDIESGWSNGSYYFDIKAEGNKNMNEEWFGLVNLSQETQDGINKRIPKKAYYVIKDFWKNPVLAPKKKAKAR